MSLVVGILGEAQSLNNFVDHPCMEDVRDLLDFSEELQVLKHGQSGEQSVILRTVPDAVPDCFEVFAYFLAENLNRPRGRLHDICQALKRSALSSAINSEQSEALSRADAERYLFNSNYWLGERCFIDLSELVNRNNLFTSRCSRYSVLFCFDVVLDVSTSFRFGW